MDTATRMQPEALDRMDVFVETCRRRLVDRLSASREGAMVADYFKNGKMIRSRLVFASASAVGGDPARVMCAAEAIELIHGASLFHDDLIDEANYRRGLPALHRRVSVSGAIVLGDYLILRAFSVLCEGREVVRAGDVLDTVRILSVQAQACCRGQFQELEQSGAITSERDYITMVRGKTAAPFVAAATTGALLAGGGGQERDALAAYSLNLGVAFQICDDMLDLCADSQTLGKPTGNSLARQRPLLPLIFLHSHGSKEAQAEWAALRQRGGTRRDLLPILRREGIDKRVRAAQDAHMAAALAALKEMRDTDGLRALQELPKYAVACWK